MPTNRYNLDSDKRVPAPDRPMEDERTWINEIRSQVPSSIDRIDRSWGKMSGGAELWIVARGDCRAWASNRSVIFIYGASYEFLRFNRIIRPGGLGPSTWLFEDFPCNDRVLGSPETFSISTTILASIDYKVGFLLSTPILQSSVS